MFLITTADQRFWRTTESILFLGEWCKLYERRHLYEKLDTETLPYHWDDRSRLYSDYQYLRGVYERYLDALVPKLNEVHGLDQSARFCWSAYRGSRSLRRAACRGSGYGACINTETITGCTNGTGTGS